MKHLIQGLNNKAYVRVESVTMFNDGRRGDNAPPTVSRLLYLDVASLWLYGNQKSLTYRLQTKVQSDFSIDGQVNAKR